MKTLAKLTYLALLSSLFFWVPPGQADDVVMINFEDQTAQTTTKLVITTPKLSVTISRQGDTFAIENPHAASFGQLTLSPGGNSSGSQFVASFSEPVTSVTFEVGDDGSQSPIDFDKLLVTAYSDPDATPGTELTTEMIQCCGTAGFSSGSITITAAGIKSIAFIGGSAFFPNSVFYDNFALTLAKQVVDLDNDGIPDNVDTCKGSDLSQPVVLEGCVTATPNFLWETGCTTTDYLMACGNNARNHGDFVNCAKEFSDSLESIGSLTKEQKADIQSCAAQASLP